MREDFQACHDATEKFVQWANDQLNETDTDLIMEETLPIRRQRRRKCMAAELSVDEATCGKAILSPNYGNPVRRCPHRFIPVFFTIRFHID